MRAEQDGAGLYESERITHGIVDEGVQSWDVGKRESWAKALHVQTVV